MPEENPLSTVERQQRLLRFVEQHQRVNVPQITEAFAISPATARRDLEALAEQGKIQRVHGGALAVRQAPPEPPVLQRSTEHAVEKLSIGRAAAQLIADGESVFIGSGTTAWDVARNLRSRQNLTVITNSLLVINELAEAPGVALVGLGGFFRRTELSFIGHIAAQTIAEVRADKVIIGIRAIDIAQGLTNDFMDEAMVDRAILKIARQAIVVADHTKLGRVSAAFVAPLASIHTLVTDANASAEFVEAVREKGVQVITA
jgi:DeoR/GlpR family transcriptional regulator of sugar metabolism